MSDSRESAAARLATQNAIVLMQQKIVGFLSAQYPDRSLLIELGRVKAERIVLDGFSSETITDELILSYFKDFLTPHIPDPEPAHQIKVHHFSDPQIPIEDK